MSVEAQAKGSASGPSAEFPEIRVVATARHRLLGVLDYGMASPPEDPSLDQVVEAALSAPREAWAWVIDGGEVTLRKDLPQLIRALKALKPPSLVMATDGLALTNPGVVRMLKELGLDAVRLRLHSSRADAHDWLVGHRGAWRRTLKAAKAIREGGLRLEVECCITRPTRPHLEESRELYTRLGAKTVWLRRVTHRGPCADNDVAVVARLGLMKPDLEPAVQFGLRRGTRIHIQGIPSVVISGVEPQCVDDEAMRWVVPQVEGWGAVLQRLEPPARERGAPSDYVARFGRDEIDAGSNSIVYGGPLPETPLAGGDTPPPGRAGRLPPTQLHYVRLAAKVPSMSGDPLFAVAPVAQKKRLRMAFVAPPAFDATRIGDGVPAAAAETTRTARIRLVKLAQHKVPVLRIADAGSLAHPHAADLLREATRLEFERIEVAGEASCLDAFTDIQIRRLRGISRIDVALFGPDAERHDAVVGVPGAFDATMRVVDRVANLVRKTEVGCYAVLSDASMVQDFVEAWDMGDLPGTPWFRLGPEGGSLVELAAVCQSLPEGAARDALCAVLPRRLCPHETLLAAPVAQEAWGDLPEVFSIVSGCDKFGQYTDRLSDPEGTEPGACPGYAVGWKRDE